MFSNEKIDRLKQEFSSAEFKIPFTDGSNILKSIETEFIASKDLTKGLNNLSQHFNDWANNIKCKEKVKSIDLTNRSVWLDKLDPHSNYWMVLANQSEPQMKHLVYDCKPNAIIALFSITLDDFFLVDKKYRWFSYFQVDKQTQRATVFRGGGRTTPFET